jgi:hypothetical protein
MHRTISFAQDWQLYTGLTDAQDWQLHRIDNCTARQLCTGLTDAQLQLCAQCVSPYPQQQYAPAVQISGSALLSLAAALRSLGQSRI